MNVLFPLFFIRKAQFTKSCFPNKEERKAQLTKYSDGHSDNLTNNPTDKAYIDKAADLTQIIHKGRAN